MGAGSRDAFAIDHAESLCSELAQQTLQLNAARHPKGRRSRQTLPNSRQRRLDASVAGSISEGYPTATPGSCASSCKADTNAPVSSTSAFTSPVSKR